MSLTTLLPPVISPVYIPRSLMDMVLFDSPLTLGLTSLDLFDPFDEVDRVLNQEITWLKQPVALIPETPSVPRVPEKHRISLYIPGFREESIKTEVKDNKLILTGKEGSPGKEGEEQEDYCFQEFKRTVELPKNLDTKNLVSFKLGDKLVVEIPIKQTKKQLESLVPVIEKSEDDSQKIVLNVEIPDNIDPSKVTVTLKDRDVIVKADYREQKENKDTAVYYMRRSTMPINTDFNTLKCTAQNGNQLKIEAKLGENPHKTIPIKIENLPQSQKQVKG